MVHEPVPCPRCAESTPPVRDACEHCGGALGPTTGARFDAGQWLLAYAVLAAGVATAVVAAVGAFLAVATPQQPAVALAPAAACLVVTVAWAVLYRQRFGDGVA